MKQLRNFKQGNPSIPQEVMDNPAFSETLKRYGGMDEDALIEQLLSQIRTARKEGTYNPAQTQSYVSMLSPFLSPAQRDKLDNLVQIINAEA